MSKIYVASSWRCTRQPEVVAALRDAGHKVYDFKNPAPDEHGFSWKKILNDPPPWMARQTIEVLGHPVAEKGFGLDRDALKWSDAVVMVQPCGRSAALELGWAVGAGKRTAVLMADYQEPELMLKFADFMTDDLSLIVAWANDLKVIKLSLISYATFRASSWWQSFYDMLSEKGLLRRDWLPRVEENYLDGAWRTRCTRSWDAFVVVATSVMEGLVGAGMVFQWRPHGVRDDWDLAIVVHPDHRRRGIGGRLARAAARVVSASEEKIRFHPDPENRSFFESLTNDEDWRRAIRT